MITRGIGTVDDERWLALPLAQWGQTRDTLQLWAQIIGKVRMANTPISCRIHPPVRARALRRPSRADAARVRPHHLPGRRRRRRLGPDEPRTDPPGTGRRDRVLPYLSWWFYCDRSDTILDDHTCPPLPSENVTGYPGDGMLPATPHHPVCALSGPDGCRAAGLPPSHAPHRGHILKPGRRSEVARLAASRRAAQPSSVCGSSEHRYGLPVSIAAANPAPTSGHPPVRPLDLTEGATLSRPAPGLRLPGAVSVAALA